jgi:uncharacterized membrane protein YfcA
VSLPTILVGFARYSRDQSFSVLRANWSIMLVMAAGSIVGTFIGGLLLGIVPSAVLLPGLAAILVISAVKVWRHEATPSFAVRPSMRLIDLAALSLIICGPDFAALGRLRCARQAIHRYL